ncbi:MAG: UbiA family prenyltransferase [Gemmatimonadales bacterium]|nr:UbiA family prenyltransferase [Gemmatimonadales bacterium]
MSDRRALGYRLFGRAFDYLLHTRPLEWPIVAVHFLTGAALALGLEGLLSGRDIGALVAGTLAFVIGLNGGTLALNSAFDNDEGDIAYLRRPPPPPRGLALFGLVLMFAGLAVAARLPRPFAVAYLVCLIFSVLYSVPPLRLKAVAGADLLINMAGFGLLTPYAGWALTGVPVGGPGTTVIVAFALLFGGLYPLTQLYQLEEDRRRGDRTLACVLGLDRSLGLSLLLVGMAFAAFGVASLQSDWSGAGDEVFRWAALAVALLTWAVVLGPWWRHRAALSPAEHQAGMHRALAAWAVTDMAVLFAWAR